MSVITISSQNHRPIIFRSTWGAFSNRSILNPSFSVDHPYDLFPIMSLFLFCIYRNTGASINLWKTLQTPFSAVRAVEYTFLFFRVHQSSSFDMYLLFFYYFTHLFISHGCPTYVCVGTGLEKADNVMSLLKHKTQSCDGKNRKVNCKKHTTQS